MPYSLILSAVAILVLHQLFTRYRSYSRNVALAKASGLPFVSTPWDVFSIFWLSTHTIWTPLIRKVLPLSLQGTWVDVLHPEWGYHLGHKVYQDVGKDMFLVVSPFRIHGFVADAEALTQITTRRADFPKPLEMYTALDIYGKNLVSTEGADWRLHRRLAAPSFGEKNNELVFNETLHHAKSLLGLWTGPDGRGNKTIEDPSQGAMNFALYVISSAGFDVRVVWPHEEEKQINPEAEATFGSSQVPPGHTMNYRQALSELLHNIMWTQIIPPKYLPYSPIKLHKTVGEAVSEWGKYMDELFETKKRQVAASKSKGGMDLFDALIRGSGIVDQQNTDLKKSDLLGNAFVLMLAGHETTANSLHYSMILLAMKWASQKHLQEDLDRILEKKPIDEWKYDVHFSKLFGGMPAAVMNETLRILQPIVNIPKSTAPGRPQQLTIDGKQYTVPGDTHIYLSAAIHRNPKYWSEDANEFRPERWLLKSKSTEEFVDIKYEDEELRGPSGEDTSAQLFKPVKGSYIPFSDGVRSCIGRRFAQVEILAVLAAIFSQYSVELAVDEWASDEEVEKMPVNGKERREVYKKACDRADTLLRTKMASIITLQLRGVTIPVRLVKRGEERFAFE